MREPMCGRCESASNLRMIRVIPARRAVEWRETFLSRVSVVVESPTVVEYACKCGLSDRHAVPAWWSAAAED